MPTSRRMVIIDTDTWLNFRDKCDTNNVDRNLVLTAGISIINKLIDEGNAMELQKRGEKISSE